MTKRQHLENIAGLHFAMLMMRLGVRPTWTQRQTQPT